MKLFLAVIAVFLVIALPGCGGGGNSSPLVTTTPVTLPAPTPPAQPAIVSHAQVTLDPSDFTVFKVAAVGDDGTITPTLSPVSALAQTAAIAGKAFTLGIVDPAGVVAMVVASDPGVGGVQYGTITSNGQVFHIKFLASTTSSGSDELQLLDSNNVQLTFAYFPQKTLQLSNY